MMKYKKNKPRGFTMVEILVTISIFAVVGILSANSLFLTIKGSKKSDSTVRVREGVNSALSIIERQLRNAEYIECPESIDSTIIKYAPPKHTGQLVSFSCVTNGTDKYIASSSATTVRLTTYDIIVSSCSFSCYRQDNNPNNPPIVKFSIVAEDRLATEAEKGTVSTDIEIVARNY